MKVLGLSGSMRKEGTPQLIQVILRQCKEAGIKTDLSPFREKDPPVPGLPEMQREEVVRDRGGRLGGHRAEGA